MIVLIISNDSAYLWPIVTPRVRASPRINSGSKYSFVDCVFVFT